jgi:hypothetical protein
MTYASCELLTFQSQIRMSFYSNQSLMVEIILMVLQMHLYEKLFSQMHLMMIKKQETGLPEF